MRQKLATMRVTAFRMCALQLRVLHHIRPNEQLYAVLFDDALFLKIKF